MLVGWGKVLSNQPTNHSKRKIKRKPKPNKQPTIDRQTERNKQKGRERKEEGGGGAHTHCIGVHLKR
jgi:hypothetical protein